LCSTKCKFADTYRGLASERPVRSMYTNWLHFAPRTQQGFAVDMSTCVDINDYNMNVRQSFLHFI